MLTVLILAGLGAAAFSGNSAPSADGGPAARVQTPALDGAPETMAEPRTLEERGAVGREATPEKPAGEQAKTEWEASGGQAVQKERAGEVAVAPPQPPSDPTLYLTVPRLGLEDVPISEGSSQVELDREGIIRLKEGGVPWKEGSNTTIVGHRLGFPETKLPYVFYELDEVKPGDELILRDSAGKEYTFRVYDLLTVRPEDYWVTYPVPGKTVISLQTCVPIPTFEKRLIVRGELIG